MTLVTSYTEKLAAVLFHNSAGLHSKEGAGQEPDDMSEFVSLPEVIHVDVRNRQTKPR